MGTGGDTVWTYNCLCFLGVMLDSDGRNTFLSCPKMNVGVQEQLRQCGTLIRYWLCCHYQPLKADIPVTTDACL